VRHLIVSVFALAAIAAQASQSVGQELAFEVASVKANKLGQYGSLRHRRQGA
jgi:hypothetical protein